MTTITTLKRFAALPIFVAVVIACAATSFSAPASARPTADDLRRNDVISGEVNLEELTLDEESDVN